ncbi:MAG: hypothetical protein ACLGIN_09740 [Candidatus Sericytochromatia bacterium]
MRRLWLLPMILLFASPAVASPEVLMPAGSAGAVLPYGLSGQLGASGLVVEATPTMLLVKAVAPGSPAALARVPLPGVERLRLAAVNGRPVEAYAREALLRCFTAGSGQVELTFARKEEGAPAERLAGPYTVRLAPGADLDREAAWLLDQGRYDELLQRLKARPASASLGGKLLLAAEHLARTGDHGRAMALASRVPAGHPAHAEARQLSVRIRLAYANEVLGRADALAGGGQYPAALAAIRGLPDEPAWRKLRQEREATWREAMAEQARYRKLKAESAKASRRR